MENSLLTKPVIMLETEEHSVNYKWHGNKVNPNVQVLSIDEFSNWLKDGNHDTLVPRHCQRGDVLVEHPYRKGSYIRIDEIEDMFFKAKGFIVSDIARLLGCKEFDWNIEVGSVHERVTSAEGEVTYKAVAEFKGEMKHTYEEEVKSKLSLNQTMSGGITQDSYERAKEKAEEYNLWGDDQIRSLIEGRNPNEQQITSRTIRVELSKETNDAMDIAFSINVLPFHGNFKYKEVVKYKKQVILVCSMKF